MRAAHLRVAKSLLAQHSIALSTPRPRAQPFPHVCYQERAAQPLQSRRRCLCLSRLRSVHERARLIVAQRRTPRMSSNNGLCALNHLPHLFPPALLLPRPPPIPTLMLVLHSAIQLLDSYRECQSINVTIHVVPAVEHRACFAVVPVGRSA